MSRICAGLDEQVTAFRDRPPHHTAFPYVFLDATYLRIRRSGPGGAVWGRTGHLDDSEDKVFWRGFLRTLKQSGLHGVRLVISTGTPASSPHWAE